MSAYNPLVPPNETTGQKAIRKFKENPGVPIFFAATCGAMAVAYRRARQGDARSMNNWLRIRVIMHGLAIAAFSVTAFRLAPKSKAEPSHIETERALTREKEHKQWEARMRAAEENYRVEKGGVSLEEVESAQERQRKAEVDARREERKGFFGWMGSGVALLKGDLPDWARKEREMVRKEDSVSLADRKIAKDAAALEEAAGKDSSTGKKI